jgi:hypothetical protein
VCRLVGVRTLADSPKNQLRAGTRVFPRESNNRLVTRLRIGCPLLEPTRAEIPALRPIGDIRVGPVFVAQLENRVAAQTPKTLQKGAARFDRGKGLRWKVEWQAASRSKQLPRRKEIGGLPRGTTRVAIPSPPMVGSILASHPLSDFA